MAVALLAKSCRNIEHDAGTVSKPSPGKVMNYETTPPGLIDAILQWIRPVPQQVPVCCCPTTGVLQCTLTASILALLLYIAVILRDISKGSRQSERQLSQRSSRGSRAIRGRSGSAEAAVYCSVGASLQAQYKPQARAARNSGTGLHQSDREVSQNTSRGIRGSIFSRIVRWMLRRSNRPRVPESTRSRP
ncbi:uncharacterized protein [Dermacentor albipictus]|uniref:uncharacterized protein n=1 Tax=Dermacentor albipictus TaxID=60249 RepID=UPI0038FD2A6E